MILESIEVSGQTTLLNITCDCGKKILWPVSMYLVECPKCNRRELWSEDGKLYPELEGYKVIKIKE